MENILLEIEKYTQELKLLRKNLYNTEILQGQEVNFKTIRQKYYQQFKSIFIKLENLQNIFYHKIFVEKQFISDLCILQKDKYNYKQDVDFFVGLFKITTINKKPIKKYGFGR